MRVELDIFERSQGSKNSVKQIRRAGNVPVIVYSKGQPGRTYSVKQSDLEAILRGVEEGFLTTTIFRLKDAAGKVIEALVKDVQYHVTTYAILHLDFIELQPDHSVDVKVPVRCLGVVECAGVKAGGYLRLVRRRVPVRCLPQHIPTFFELDIRDLDLRQSKRVSDLQLPQHVAMLVKPEEVIVSIVK